MQHTTFSSSFSSSKLSFFPPFPPYSHHTRVVLLLMLLHQQHTCAPRVFFPFFICFKNNPRGSFYLFVDLFTFYFCLVFFGFSLHFLCVCVCMGLITYKILVILTLSLSMCISLTPLHECCYRIGTTLEPPPSFVCLWPLYNRRWMDRWW
jgi:hypothetical protein